MFYNQFCSHFFMYFTIKGASMQEDFSPKDRPQGIESTVSIDIERVEKEQKLESIITENSCLIDILKDACELNIDLEYVSVIHSALSVISKKQIETLQLIGEMY